jgi:hypothetical protein
MKHGDHVRRSILCAVFMLLLPPAGVVAQERAPSASAANDQHTHFPSVGQQLPALLSGSGRFSAIDPPHQVTCGTSVAGRVVSRNLIFMRNDFDCAGGFRGHDMLVNVELADPVDAAKMIPGTAVVVQGTIKNAMEKHNGYIVFFIFVENARVTPFGTEVDPTYANFTYMNCQPPELDALAKQLGRELCVQNTLVTNLAATGQTLEAAAHAPAKISPGDPVSGDPAAITCRLDPERSDAELSAITCARNNYWVWWRAKWFNPSGIGTTGPP